MHKKRLQSLLKKLGSPEPSTRRHAAEALSDSDERAVYPLIKALRDESPGVQEAAMHSLVEIGGEVTAYMVQPLLRDEPSIRNMALIILKELGRVKLLLPLLKDKDDDIRKFAVDLLSEIGDKGGCRYLEEMIHDPNPNVRAACMTSIGKLKCRGLTEAVINALDDEEWVIFSAVEALGELGDSSAVVPISRLIKRDSEPLRYAAIEALGKIGGTEAEGTLTDFIENSSGTMRTAAIRSLLSTGPGRKIKGISGDLLTMLSSNDMEEVKLALRGISSIGLKESTPDLLDRGGAMDPLNPGGAEMIPLFRECLASFGCTGELLDTLASDRLKYRGKVLAIEVAGECGCSEAVPVLKELINSSARDIRRAGVRALDRLQIGEDGDLFLSKTNDPDGHVREAAITALGRLRDGSAFDPLIELLHAEPYINVKERIVEALLSIDEMKFISLIDGYESSVREMAVRYSNSFDTLIRLSTDGNPSVRVSSLLALGRFSDKRAVEMIIRPLVEDPSSDVRKAVAQSIEETGCCKDALHSLLSDEDMWVRFHALKALPDTDGTGDSALIISGLRDRAVPVVLKAIELISGFPPDEAKAALKELTGHPDEVVKEKVMEVLEQS